MIRYIACVALLGAFAATSSAAVTFSNFVYDPSIFTSDPVVSGNALTWFPTDAASAGDLSASSSQTVNFSYDAFSAGGLGSSFTLGQTFLLGSGAFSFTQKVYALDAAGNVTKILGTISSASETNLLTFSPSQRIRVESSFVLNAPDGTDLDISSLSLVNQNVQAVPSPAALASFGLGALGTLRRRSRRRSSL